MKLFAALALMLSMTLLGCSESAAPDATVLEASNKVEATVQGMDCAGCTGEVCSAIQQVAGVTGATADLKTGLVTVSLADDADGEAAKAEIESVIAGLSEGKYTVSTIAVSKADCADCDTCEDGTCDSEKAGACCGSCGGEKSEDKGACCGACGGGKDHGHDHDHGDADHDHGEKAECCGACGGKSA